jgi:hypothetical protein
VLNPSYLLTADRVFVVLILQVVLCLGSDFWQWFNCQHSKDTTQRTVGFDKMQPAGLPAGY